MKIFLKNPKSQLLLNSTNEWTPNPEDALSFPDTGAAIRYSVQRNLWRLRVVLYFNDGSQFVRCVVPNRLEACLILQAERLITAVKRHLANALPSSKTKHNPFAMRIS